MLCVKISITAASKMVLFFQTFRLYGVLYVIELWWVPNKEFLLKTAYIHEAPNTLPSIFNRFLEVLSVYVLSKTQLGGCVAARIVTVLFSNENKH